MFLVYLDPGSGSLIIQFLIAALSGVVLFFGNIKAMFSNILNKKNDSNQANNDHDNAQ